MTIRKRILAAALSGVVAAGAVPAALPLTGYAATLTTSYDEDDLVDYDLFLIKGEDLPNEKFIEALERAAGRKDWTELTYADLAKITSLNLSGLGLEGIPPVIEYMYRLRTLNLSNNQLRSSTINSIDLSGCYALTSVDLSKNYLTTIPAWYTALDISTKKISYNLINTTNQRHIKISPDTFYFTLGDEVTEDDLNKLKDRIISTCKLSDGSELPPYFYDPELPTYDLGLDEDEKADQEYVDSIEKNENIEVDLGDISKYINSKNIVDKAGTATGEISLFVTGASSNPNIRAKITIHFLDGNDPTSVKVRLNTLIKECEEYEEDGYTDSSWNAFKSALKTATTIYEYENADADMLKGALDDLSQKKNALVKGVSETTKKTLQDLITIAKDFKADDYTTESWKAFETALAMLNAAVSNPDTSIIEANAAIKAFQEAQSGLVATALSVPDIVPKSAFESIYGEDKVITYTGVTRSGYRYTWVFNGKDIKTPADFNPEIKYESQHEEAIRFEVGSASDYHLFSFAATGAFPGAAEISLDISGTYVNGSYRLYKWNTSTKKSEFVKDVDVKDGLATIKLEEGGDYFISSVLQNFQMISSNFDIDHNKLSIAGKFKNKYKVTDFRNALENGEAVTILNADGTPVAETEYIATGMTASAANSDVAYSIIVPGDVDGDGLCTALDAVTILKAIIGDITLGSYAQKAAADITGDGWVRADDAVAILKYCIGME